ncbi:MAG: S1 RNA-binding domain-containing protein [Dehalococcoidia bacterium]|nr:S1 RNA-binding domain-containing protein [Dehalococcoidia bacterium]
MSSDLSFEVDHDSSQPAMVEVEGMAQLWEDGAQDFRSFQRGEIVDGIVMQVDKDSLLVDIGSKTEGIVPNSEMRSLGSEGTSQLKVGDTVLVYVLQPENQEGQVILSVDRATGERGWRSLQERSEAGDIIEAEVVGYNKGGLLVNLDGIRGFVPVSQVVGLRTDGDTEEALEERFTQWIGRHLKLKIIEIDRRRNRLVLSERVAVLEWRSQQKGKLFLGITEGEIRSGVVTSIRDFGVFVDLGGADGLIHLTELSWGRVTSPEDLVKIGDEIEVVVLKVDQETQRIALSLKKAQPEGWDNMADKYQVGQLVKGTITKLTNFGAFAHIEGPLDGLIHISELADRRVSHPKEVVKEGDVVTLKLVRIEKDKHRLALSLRQAVADIESLEEEYIREQLNISNRSQSQPSRTIGDMADLSSVEALGLLAVEVEGEDVGLSEPEDGRIQ